MRNLLLLTFTRRLNQPYLNNLSYTPIILPTLFLNHTTTFIYRLTPTTTIQHIHQITNVTSYQPIVLLSNYQGYLQKLYARTYVRGNAGVEKITVQLQSLLKNPSVTRKLYPLYRNIWQDILQEEQHYYRSRPTQSLGLLAPLLSHRQTFGVLTKFYLGKMNKEEIMRYASLYPSPFYTWRILQGLSSTTTFKHPFQQFTMLLQPRNVPSLQYVYTKKMDTKNNVENKNMVKNELPTVDKKSFQETMNSHNTSINMQTSSISFQDMKQIITEVTKKLEKQYRYEAKRYGRGS